MFEEQVIEQSGGLGIPRQDVAEVIEKPLNQDSGRSEISDPYVKKELKENKGPAGRDMRAPLDSLDSGNFKSYSESDKKLTPQQEVDRAGDTFRSFMFGEDHANQSKKSEDKPGFDEEKDLQGSKEKSPDKQNQKGGEQDESGLDDLQESQFDPILGELKGLREDIKKTNQTQQPQEVKPVGQSVTDEQYRQFQILEELETLNPSKYEGIKDKYQDYLRRATEYQKQWQEENPKQKFNASDEEHQEWVAENEPQIDIRDWSDAQVEVKVKRTKQEFQQELKKREFDFEMKEFERSGLGGEMNNLLKDIDPKAFSLLSEKGPKALLEADPETYEILNREAATFQSYAVELKKLLDGAGIYKFDANNHVHQKLDSLALVVESEIKKLPRSQQIRDGKVFATFDELSQVPYQERSRYWTVGFSDITPKLRSEFSKSGQTKIQNFRKKIEHYIKSQGASAQNQEKQNNSDSFKNTSKTNASNKSPSGSVGGQFSNIDETNGGQSNKQDSVLFKAMFGG